MDEKTLSEGRDGEAGEAKGWDLHEGVVRGAHGEGVGGERAVGHHQHALAGRVRHDVVALVIQLHGVDDGVSDMRGGACGRRQRWGREGMSVDGSARGEAW
jgi:hypothetical protein